MTRIIALRLIPTDGDGEDGCQVLDFEAEPGPRFTPSALTQLLKSHCNPDHHAIFARKGLWRGPLSALPMSAPLQLSGPLPMLELVLLPEKDDGSLALSLARAQLSVPHLGDRKPAVPGNVIGASLPTSMAHVGNAEVTPAVDNGGVVAHVDNIGTDVGGDKMGANTEATDHSGPENAPSARVVSVGSDDGGNGGTHDAASSGSAGGGSEITPNHNAIPEPASQEAHSASSLIPPTKEDVAERADSSHGTWGLATDIVKILSEGGRPRSRQEQRELARDALRAGDGDRILLCLGRLEGEGPPVAGGRADRFDDPAAVAERARRRHEEGEERKIGAANVRNGAIILLSNLSFASFLVGNS